MKEWRMPYIAKEAFTERNVKANKEILTTGRCREVGMWRTVCAL